MDNLWYKDAVMYELYIRAFKDSSNTGHGDIRGLISKLDYLKEVGIDCILIMPIYPSPGKDDGYDIEDYYSIHPMLGTLEDFEDLLSQAHKMGIKVVIELVINHTSDRHKWFSEASKGPDNPYHNYYIWSDTPEKFREAPILYPEYIHSNWAYHPKCKKYYFHRYYSHEPDLNYYNPEVKNEIKKVIKFWLDLGVDGLRFDNIAYLFKREGTNCENLPETHLFVKELRKFVDENYENRILLGKINQPYVAQAKYFGDADEFHMLFRLPGPTRLFLTIKQENWEVFFKWGESLPDIPLNCQWAIFLRDHNELSLEMFTSEEKEYMYSVYPKEYFTKGNRNINKRLTPLLDNDQRRIELLYAILFAIPGTPIIYYGDEIGMGDNIYLGYRNSLRTPMQWNDYRNAGFSNSTPSKLYAPIIIDPEYHYSTVNVEVQQNRPSSIYNFLKKLISCRKRHKSFSRGKLVQLPVREKEVVKIMRIYQDETILIIGNMSRSHKYVELDLSNYMGMSLLEVYSDVIFPQIVNAPYILTLSPYAFYYLKFVPSAPAI